MADKGLIFTFACKSFNVRVLNQGNMKKSLSILLFAVLASGCMKRENLYDEERAAEEEAKKNFPVQNIDPGTA